jgi:hypothetical protein
MFIFFEIPENRPPLEAPVAKINGSTIFASAVDHLLLIVAHRVPNYADLRSRVISTWKLLDVFQRLSVFIEICLYVSLDS